MPGIEKHVQALEHGHTEFKKMVELHTYSIQQILARLPERPIS